jgi:signal transduction histidine kinase
LSLLITGGLLAAWAGTAVAQITGPAGLIGLGAGMAMFGTGAALLNRARNADEIGAAVAAAERSRRHNDALETEVAALGTELERTRDALAASDEENRRRSEYVLMLNHELRAPMTGVVTGARILSQSLSLDMDERDLLENVIADGERLEAVLSQMLFIARSDDRALAAEPTTQSLGQVVDRIRRIHRTTKTSMTQGIGLRPIDVTTDATTLTQIVSTLVDNAYTHGANRVEVVVTNTIPSQTHHQIGKPAETPVFVAVVDDGPGIDRRFVPKAFDAFTKRSGSPGAGLGLSMVAMMVEAIGASLSVVSSSKGTVMAIGIPAQVRAAA